MTSVTIDCFHEHFPAITEPSAVVAVDVIRASTTALTAALRGRRCYPARSIEAAVPLAAALENPLLAGELGGRQPYGFHLQNSPAELDERTDIERPLILLSTSGTRLMDEAARSHSVFLGTMRNPTALGRHLAGMGRDVVLLGAASRGEFREEDQICCARIAGHLIDHGYKAGSAQTQALVSRWRDAPPEALVQGNSGAYLRATGQEHDLEFVVDHIDDVDEVFAIEDGEVRRVAG